MAKQTNSEPSRGTATRPSTGNGDNGRNSSQNITRSEPSSGGAVRPK
jgi:hypothetical protein